MNKNVIAIAAISLMGTFGCAVPPGENYDIYIEHCAPSSGQCFSAEQEVDIAAMSRKWELAEIEFGLNISVKDDPVFGDYSFNIHPMTLAEIASNFGEGIIGETHMIDTYQEGDIYLPVDQPNREEWLTTVLHEQGHMLGAHHYPNGIMYPDWTGNPKAITCTDRSNFAKIRGEEIVFCSGNIPVSEP